MRPLHRSVGLRRSVARGVALTYFALIGMPTLFFGAGMAVDFTRIIISARQVSNAAQAAALAGAQQFTVNDASINVPRAVSAATETYCLAKSAGALSLSSNGTSGARACPGALAGQQATIVVKPMRVPDGAAVGVDVTARYRVTDLLFAGFFTDPNAGPDSSVTRTATLCIPGVATGPTNGYCAHPLQAR